MALSTKPDENLHFPRRILWRYLHLPKAQLESRFGVQAVGERRARGHRNRKHRKIADPRRLRRVAAKQGRNRSICLVFPLPHRRPKPAGEHRGNEGRRLDRVRRVLLQKNRGFQSRRLPRDALTDFVTTMRRSDFEFDALNRFGFRAGR